MDEREAIFRKVVVERLSSPDQLDQLLQVLRPRSWALLLAIGLLLVTGFVWSISGTVAVTLPASGVLMRTGGINDITAPESGRVVRVSETGDVVSAGRAIATIRMPPGVERDITVPVNARVVEVLARPGQHVSAGAALLSFEPEDEALRAMLFVTPEKAMRIRAGMPVRISASGRSARQSHEGKILEVASYPATTRGLESFLADRELADELVRGNRRWRVIAELPPAGTANGIDLPRVSRMKVRAQIVLREERPIEQFLPWLGGG